MKYDLDSFWVIMFSITFIFGISFFVFSFQQHSNFTGFVVHEEIENQDSLTIAEIIEIEEEKIITEEIASQAINDSEKIIIEMSENNFSIIYMEDILLEAKNIFWHVQNAEILRNSDSSKEEQNIARKNLISVNWRSLYYEDVLVNTEDIKNRRNKAFILYDSIILLEKTIKEYEEDQVNISDSKSLLDEARIAFYEDRYKDTDEILQEIRDKLEIEKIESFTFSEIQKNTKNFFQRYWLSIILFLIFIFAAGYFSYKKINIKLLKTKIKNMKNEELALIDLMKKAQTDRFKKNIISGLVYNIKIKKYKEKLQLIKQELPVLESQLIKRKDLK